MPFQVGHTVFKNILVYQRLYQKLFLAPEEGTRAAISNQWAKELFAL